jgi:hypothetical protein
MEVLIRIKPFHLTTCFVLAAEFLTTALLCCCCLLLLLQATIAGGGVIPHIHKSLINKGPKKE